MILSRYHRSLLSQTRSWTLPIRIESGRFRNEPLEYRLCVLCETNDVEDEIHFILLCSKYTGCRQTLLSNIQNDSFHTLSDLEKLKFLCDKYTRQLAKFIAEAYDIRKNVIYKPNVWDAPHITTISPLAFALMCSPLNTSRQRSFS